MGSDGIAHRLRHTPIARILQIAGMLIAAAALARVIAAGFAANAATTPPVGEDAESVGDFVTTFAPQDSAFVVFLDAVGDRGGVVGLVALVVLCSAVVLGNVPTRREAVVPLVALGVLLLSVVDDLSDLADGSGRVALRITELLVGLAVVLAGFVLAAIARRPGPKPEPRVTPG